MTIQDAESEVQQFWMTLTEEERFLTCAGIYEGEKAILERLAPKDYSRTDVLEFVFYHLHGMTVEECINRVPEKIL